MKILIVVPDSDLGGVTSSAVNFATELASRGNEVYFLDMSAQISKRNLLPEGVQAVSLEGASCHWNIGLGDVRKAKGLGKFVALLLGAVKKLTIRSGLWYRMIFSRFDQYGEFDVAIAFRQCDPCYSFVLNKVPAKKKIGFVHGELKYMGDISSWKRHMTKFHKIAYVSNAVREEFVAEYPELEKNACTIYNTFDVEKIKIRADEVCDVLFDKCKVNIVTVARVDNEFKQIHWIPQICEKLKHQTKIPFCWYVVGDGPDFDETVALSRNCGTEDVLTFVGKKNNPYPFIRESDFTVLTSKSEAYGMVIVESFILKKPVVATEYPALWEIMKDGREGLIACQSIECVTKCVICMIENSNGIKAKCENYLETIADNRDAVYEQFLDSIA